MVLFFFFFSSRRRHTRWPRDWSSDVCSSDLGDVGELLARARRVGNRPMLDGRSGDEIEELYRSRRSYYGRAQLTIDTTGRSADQVVSLVLAALRDAHAVRA